MQRYLSSDPPHLRHLDGWKRPVAEKELLRIANIFNFSGPDL